MLLIVFDTKVITLFNEIIDVFRRVSVLSIFHRWKGNAIKFLGGFGVAEKLKWFYTEFSMQRKSCIIQREAMFMYQYVCMYEIFIYDESEGKFVYNFTQQFERGGKNI